jgi:membrane-bound acyltransferase YfiQ involved in biofilm formation
MWCSAGLLKAVAGLSGSLLVLGFCRLITAPVLNRPLNFLSRHSYSIYLIHQPFLVSGIAGVLLMITPLPFAVICAITLLSGIFIPVFLSTTVIGKIPFARAALLGEFRK